MAEAEIIPVTEMRITYFDEIKANVAIGFPWYIVGGLSASPDAIASLEEKANDLAEEVFGTRDLRPNTEFHASHLYSGKSHFKGMAVDRRVEILQRLGQLIGEAEGVSRIYASINTPELYSASKAPEYAFMHFCERVQKSLPPRTKTILIGDQDDENYKHMIASFATYRANGTPWSYGIKIGGILDAVHFARSHHSRMIQLADTYLFLSNHYRSVRKGWQADKLKEAIQGIALGPHRYKEWPTAKESVGN
ncbi:DUF3800 domain-containing protein [Sphingobium sp. KCTC 72723]|uniref:DUF3800 domain-containing protein n=1 Tax=Sphingobium sp. KCTC 72723 TaxID=2733867 RepID=UPI00165DF44B|nr:DUF3800 domain-containing protein [Sphingobium sp. KCTC 72723]